MSIAKKILIFCISAAVLIFGGIQVYNLLYYRMYKGYTKYLTDYTVEEGGKVNLADGGDVPGMSLVSESAFLKLYTNTETAEVAIYDKRNSKITYSNPPEADNDMVAKGLNKSYLKSQLIVSYYSAKRVAATFNTYDHSVKLSQFNYEAIENGIRYTYTLGDFSSATGIVPVYISKERLEAFASKLSDAGYRYIRGRYREWSEREGYMELNSAAQRQATLRKMTEYLEEAGYTEDDYIADMTASGVEDAIPISFVIALEYRLSDDYLEVSVPAKLISESGGGMLSQIQVLRYFGAAGLDEEGYMLLPNGSGSLVYFNNGKDKVENYNQFVYGIDPMVAEYIVTEETQKARLPIFGISRKGSGIFASIESGETLSSISAYVSGNLNSYNFVYPSFIVRSGERLTMFGATDLNAELPIVEKDFYDVNLSINYYFLTDEYEGYSGMANFYREKLINEGVLKERVKASDIPFYMDIAGGVQGTGYILGSQYLKTIPMTNFKQAGEMTEELYGLGITNQVVNYQGWFNRGYYHDVPDKINVIGKLGGKKGLEEYTNAVEQMGGKVYGDVAIQNVTFSSKRYNYKLETSRYYGAGYIAAFGVVHPVANMQTSSMGYTEVLYDLLSPKFINRYVDKFAKKINNIDITGVALRDLGDSLHSDKKRTELINREQAKNIITAQFDTLASTGKDLLISGGNLYSLKYGDDLVNIPLSHNAFFLMDEEVPFYQMVVHGYLNYSGVSINLNSTADNDEIALRLIESGASPHYTFTYESSSLLKKTGLNNYRSTTFENWKADAASVYKTVNRALKNVAGHTIVKHEILLPGVTKTYYENGVLITVNKNNYAVEYEGKNLNAKSYEVGAWQ